MNPSLLLRNGRMRHSGLPPLATIGGQDVSGLQGLRAGRLGLLDAAVFQAPRKAELASKGNSKPHRINGFGDEIIEKLPIGIIILEVEDRADLRTARIAEVNSAATEMAGLSTQSAKGKTVNQIPQFAQVGLTEQSAQVVESEHPKDIG
jgi:PAS domain